MTTSIYRQEALAYRLHHRSSPSTDTPAGFPRSRTALWILLTATLVAATAAFLVPVPVTTSALAVSPATPEGPGLVAVIFDPSDATGATPGTLVTISPLDAPGARTGEIVSVEATPVDATTVATILDLPLAIAGALPPAVTLSWVALNDGIPLPPGTVGSATADIDDVRAGTVIPVVGHWFGGRS